MRNDKFKKDSMMMKVHDSLNQLLEKEETAHRQHLMRLGYLIEAVKNGKPFYVAARFNDRNQVRVWFCTNPEIKWFLDSLLVDVLEKMAISYTIETEAEIPLLLKKIKAEIKKTLLQNTFQKTPTVFEKKLEQSLIHLGRESEKDQVIKRIQQNINVCTYDEFVLHTIGLQVFVNTNQQNEEILVIRDQDNKINIY